MYDFLLDMSSKMGYYSCMVEISKSRRGRARGGSTPPYLALAESLRRRIGGSRLPPGSPLGSEVALAEESGLSRMTVRRAVQALIDENLLERKAGRGLFVAEAKPRPRRILYLAGNLLWMPAVRAAHAIQSLAEERGVEVSVFDARGDITAFRRELASLPDSGFSGAIAMSQHDAECNRLFGALSLGGFPLVVIDQSFSEIPLPSVASDNRAGGRLAAEALIAAGHRNIAFLGDLDADTTAARAQGVADACAAALVPPPAKYDIPAQRFDDWEPAVREGIRKILATTPATTAIACSCDAVARIALRALAEAGVEVPRDMSLTGFDDDPIAEWTSPPLTTVRQDFDDMGRRALELLEGAMAGGAKATGEILPVSFVSRNSISMPKAPVRRTA